MQFFEILTQLKDRFEWNGIPYQKNGNMFLPDSEVISLHSGWSDMHFHFWNRAKYVLYLNFYNIKSHRITRVQSDESTVEFTLMLTNQIVNQLGGLRQNKILNSFFNINYLSNVDSVTEFMAGQFYCTLDIHLKEIFILELLRDFPEIMEPFINAIQSKKSRFFFPSYMPTTLFMNDLSRSIIDTLRFGGNLMIVDKDVEAMIVHALTYLSTNNRKQLNISRRQLMNEIYFKLVDSSFKIPEIKQLCRIAGMNATTLRQIFKETFNMTIHQCWMKLKLDNALCLIKKDREKRLEEISKEVGFSCLANFSKVFKKEYNIPPSQLKMQTDLFDLFPSENF